MRAPSPVQTWTPPPIGLLNINSDVAFVRESRAGAWGFIIRDLDGEVVGVFIIRDQDGEVVIAGAGRLEVVHDVLMAEAVP